MDNIQNCESYDIPSLQTYTPYWETLVEKFKSALADTGMYREQIDNISLVLIIRNKKVNWESVQNIRYEGQNTLSESHKIRWDNAYHIHEHVCIWTWEWTGGRTSVTGFRKINRNNKSKICYQCIFSKRILPPFPPVTAVD
jgi:hypothetical protein